MPVQTYQVTTVSGPHGWSFYVWHFTYAGRSRKGRQVCSSLSLGLARYATAAAAARAAVDLLDDRPDLLR